MEMGLEPGIQTPQRLLPMGTTSPLCGKRAQINRSFLGWSLVWVFLLVVISLQTTLCSSNPIFSGAACACAFSGHGIYRGTAMKKLAIVYYGTARV